MSNFPPFASFALLVAILGGITFAAWYVRQSWNKRNGMGRLSTDEIRLGVVGAFPEIKQLESCVRDQSGKVIAPSVSIADLR